MPSESTIQLRFGEDAFPVSRLILDRARTLRLSRRALVRRLGYRDLGKGHNALSGLLMTGTVPSVASKNLASALEIDQAIVDAMLSATARQKGDMKRAAVLAYEDTYRADFVPHLQVQTERRIPSPIFAAAMIGVARLRVVPLPDEAITATGSKRAETLKRVITNHYCERRGGIPTFGKITGYILVLVPGYEGMDFGVPFGVNGEPTGSVIKVGRLPVATLGLKRGDQDLLPEKLTLCFNGFRY